VLRCALYRMSGGAAGALVLPPTPNDSVRQWLRCLASANAPGGTHHGVGAVYSTKLQAVLAGCQYVPGTWHDLYATWARKHDKHVFASVKAFGIALNRGYTCGGYFSVCNVGEMHTNEQCCNFVHSI
jgi:hypothetical protein